MFTCYVILVKIDLFLGVRTESQIFYYDDFDPELSTPLQMMLTEDKSYSDGELYEEGMSFNFQHSSSDQWAGPCLYLKASVGFAVRDTKCSVKLSYICQWKGKELYCIL